MKLFKKKKRIIGLTSLFLLGVVIFTYVIKKADIKLIGQRLEEISLGKVVVLILLSTFIFLIYSFNLNRLLLSQGLKIRFLKSAVLKYIGDAICYITPVVYIGGEFIMAYILKKDHNLPMSRGMAAIVMEKMIALTVTIFYFVLGLIAFLFYFTSDIKIILPTIIVLVGSVGFLIFFYLKTWRSQGLLFSLLKFFRLHKIKIIADGKLDIEKFDEHLHHFFKYNSRYFFYSLAIVVFGTFATLLEYKLILNFLGYNLNLIEILMLRVIFMASAAVPIPGALGTQEAAQAGYFSILGLGATAGVSFMLVLRFLQLINVSMGLIFLSLYGFKIFRPNEINDNKLISDQ